MSKAAHLSNSALLVSNYPSDTAYAWWLMEHFWITLHTFFASQNLKTILCFPAITTISQQIADSNIKTEEFDVPNAGLVEIYRYIKKNRITIVYLTDQPYFSTKYWAMRLAGAKLIINHDHTPGDRPKIEGLRKIIKSVRNRFSPLCVNAIYNVSELMKTRSIENACFPGTHCHVIQNGIRPLADEGSSRFDVRSKLGISEDAIIIISSGRAHPYKRFDFILSSFLTAIKAQPDINAVLVLAGDGPLFEKLNTMVKSGQLENRVKLLGFRRDIHELLFCSDIAIHASLGEGFSLSILEYMSAGLPVLVPNIPSVSQAINPEAEGLIYQWDDCNAAAFAILKLISDESLRHKMGKNAQVKAHTEYTLEKCTNELINTTRTLIETTL